MSSSLIAMSGDQDHGHIHVTARKSWERGFTMCIYKYMCTRNSVTKAYFVIIFYDRWWQLRVRIVCHLCSNYFLIFLSLIMIIKRCMLIIISSLLVQSQYVHLTKLCMKFLIAHNASIYVSSVNLLSEQHSVVVVW